jgi:bacillithiol biosynthesis cysteine-adding enzyme BshC
VKLVSGLPPASSLVRDFLAGTPSALDFYPGGHPADLEAYRAKALEVDTRFDREARERLASALSGGGTEGAARLERFVAEGGYAVTTGQQPGLLGGPLYSLYKALGAAALAERLESELGRPVIPVFWVASEDHDWAEVRGVELATVQNEPLRIQLPDVEGAGTLPLHRSPLGASLDEAREALLAALPPSDFLPWIRADLEASYRAGATLPEAFAALMVRHLHGAGVFVLSPQHPGLQAAALPVLLAEARQAATRDRELRERARQIEAAGYEVQVPILEGGVNLFLEGVEGRDRLFLEPEEGSPAPGSPASFRLRREGRTLTLAQLEAEAAAHPARLSPNVLLRPVVESALVPTLAYVAGPGEVAYHAQTAPVFQGYGIRPPVVHPRPSLVVLESRVTKVMEKFGLSLEALRRPEHEVVSEVMRDELPQGVQQALGELRGALARGARTLGQAVREVDPTLQAPAEQIRNQGFALLDDVEKRVIQALKREQGVALAQIGKARLQLYPGGRPQERVFPAVYYLARYGPSLLDAWLDEARAALLLPPD